MSRTVKDLHDALESWAPAATAQSWDNVGLLIGRMDRPIRRVLIALDLVPSVVEEAIEKQADCVLTHHPLLFKPLKKLTDSTLESSLALRMAEAGIALYTSHTNLDAARDGVSFKLARRLGVKRPAFLTALDDAIVKVAVFCPVEQADAVRDAMFAAGGGHIGGYAECSFTTAGAGTFRPGEGTNPFIGRTAGPRETVSEVRIEMEVPRWNLSAVLAGMKTAHPYEEVAYDMIPVEQSFREAGLGAIGKLEQPVSLRDFLNTTSRALNAPAVRYVGNPEQMVHTVAVCGGSGSDFIGRAMSAGADVYVTADVTYHRYFEVLGTDGHPRMALINAGHFETERCTEDLLADRLSALLPGVRFETTSHRTSPVRTWVAHR